MKLSRAFLIDSVVQIARLAHVKNALVVLEGNHKALFDFIQEATEVLVKKGFGVKVNRIYSTIKITGGPTIHVECHQGEGVEPNRHRGMTYQHIVFDEAMEFDTKMDKSTFELLAHLRG